MFKRKGLLEEKMTDYFQILQVEIGASPEEIRKAYLERVKENPPEEKPQEFQKIRKAYDLLRDPEARQKYIRREQAPELEKIIGQVMESLMKKDFSQALSYITRAQEINPFETQLYYYGLVIGKSMQDMDLVESQFQKLEEHFPEEPTVDDYLNKANFLWEFDQEDEAKDLLMEIIKGAKEKDRREIFTFLSYKYFENSEYEKLVEMLEEVMPSLEEQKPDDLELIIYWIDGLIELKRWNEKPKIRKRIKTLFQSMKHEEDREYSLYLLKEEFKGYFKVSRFKEAQFFFDLIFFIDKNPALRDIKKNLLELVSLEKDYKRMWKDHSIYPPVIMYAHELYAEEFYPYKNPYDFRESHPEIEEDFTSNEDYAAGILRLKKRYSTLYRYYQEEWEELFEEKTADLNRSARRRLR